MSRVALGCLLSSGRVGASGIEASVAHDRHEPRRCGIHVGARKRRHGTASAEAEINVEPLERDLVATKRIAHLTSDAGHKQDIVAVSEDIEAGQVEGARVERAVGGVHVCPRSVVVTGRISETANSRAECDGSDLPHIRATISRLRDNRDLVAASCERD